MTKIKTVDRCITVFLNGEIDHHTARIIREEIDAAIDENKPHTLILDFREITFMDSSGIGLVMGRIRQMQLLRGELHITNCSPHIEKVMRLAGMDRLAVLDQKQLNSKKGAIKT